MLIGPSSSVAVSLYPERDSYSDPFVPVEQEFSRSADGTLYRVNEPKFRRWEMDVGWVPVADANNINSWWTSQASLLFWEDESLFPTSAFPVSIVNRITPLNEWQFPYYNTYKKGKLLIETRSAGYY